MSYHSHQLNSASHSHIIGRTDPITGDTIEENDKVVFCLSCQSCFLEESWNYINNSHCKQTDTLFFAPYIPTQLVAKRKKADNSEPLLSKNSISILLILFFYGMYGSSIYFLLEDFLLFKDRILSSMLIGIFPAFLSVMGITSNKFKQFIGIKKPKETDIYIIEEGLQINDTLFVWSNIEKIEYQRTVKEGNSFTSAKIKICLKNGNTVQEKFDTKSPEHQKSFLLALAWASEHTKVEFYTENQQEYALLISVEKNYENMKLLVDGNSHSNLPSKI